MSTVIDIAARVEAESAARNSAALFANLARQVPGVIYQFMQSPGAPSRFPFATDALQHIFEVKPEDVLHDASPVLDRVHPDDRAIVAESAAESARTLEPWRCEFRVQLPRQGLRWVCGEAQPERLDDGGTLWHGFMTDCTERRLAHEALRLCNQMIETAVTAIAISDGAGRPTYVNPAFVRLWGYDSEAEILGRDMIDFVPREVGLPPGLLEQLLANDKWEGEITMARRDGTHFIVMALTNIVRDKDGAVTHMMSSYLDVTDAKRLQAQFLQAQKMESVGRLAGGIAHDFNNLLTVIRGSLDLALEAVPSDSGLRDELLDIGRAADSAAELTQQLLAFSRKQIIAPQVLELGAVVRRVRAMLQRMLGEDVLLEVIDGSAGNVRFDPSQVEQILVNLAVNARDAMPHGGRLTLETSNVVLDEEYVRAHPGVEAGDFVLLAVSDSGHGMTPETLSHAFEPFFTTKEVGQGTGLGLSMIHGAVSQNGGRVEVYSEAGHGTSFKIYLPRVLDAVAPPREKARPLLPRGHESLLVVEDDAAVRSLVIRMLERQGYRVYAFESGPAAIEWVTSTTDPLHLLLTDVIMPGMNGRVLAERINALRPGIRVLYASGYTANVIVHQGTLKQGVEFLAKPFTAAALSIRVRELLDQQGEN
jgi:two-component system, cell cycle sensor histidine kinase and response regulator CckA